MKGCFYLLAGVTQTLGGKPRQMLNMYNYVQICLCRKLCACMDYGGDIPQAKNKTIEKDKYMLVHTYVSVYTDSLFQEATLRLVHNYP